MQFISPRIHGLIDYLVGFALIMSPWMFGFASDVSAQADVATWLPIALGIVIIGMSLITQYEFSVAKIIAYSTHLVMDMAGGLFLAVSPWLFGYADYVFVPHLIVGLAIVGISFFSVRMDSINKTNRLVESNV